MDSWKHTRTAALSREIRRLLAEHVSDGSRYEIATSGHSPGPLGKEILRLLGERGRLGIGWPYQYGDQGPAMSDQTIAGHHTGPKPFIWTKTARDILQKVSRATRLLSSEQ